MPPRQFDIFAPSALPTANLGRKQLATTSRDTDEALDEVYKTWNARIDDQVAASIKALKELVSQADQPDPTAQILPALHLKLKTSNVIRCAQALRETAHELQLALALGSEVEAVERRDGEVVRLRAEAARLRREIAKEGGLLVGGVGGEGIGDESGEVEAGEGADADAGNAEMEKGESETKAGSTSPVKSSTKEEAQLEQIMDVDDEDEFEEVLE